MEALHLSVELLIFLFVVSIAAGLIDTLAGGGGLVVLPALIMSGVPPLQALGTNKLQGTMGTATATLMMFRKRKVSWPQVKYMMLSAFIGAVIGTIIVQMIDTQILSFIIPLVLLFIGVYFLLSGTPTQETGNPKMELKGYTRKVVPIVGFYDGMFGPGTGSFFALCGVYFRAKGLINATAEAKPLNFSTNIASLIVFIIAGQVIWSVGILMMVGQIFGAWLGARCLFIANPKYIRAAVVIMCFSMLLKYAHSMGWLFF
jgi:uncharacterized membrane protein YfcA